MNGRPLLRATGLVKSFGAVRALDGADFELYPGEIKAYDMGAKAVQDAVAFLRVGKEAAGAHDADLRDRYQGEHRQAGHREVRVPPEGLDPVQWPVPGSRRRTGSTVGVGGAEHGGLCPT